MKTTLTTTVSELISYTRLAPSVHNVQPWRFQLRGNELSLFLASERTLQEGDPTSRGLWLSMGIMHETILKAAEALGLQIDPKRTQFTDPQKPIATYLLNDVHKPHNSVLLQDIKRRKTYRGRVKKRPIPDEVVAELTSCAKDLPGVQIFVRTDSPIKELTGKLTYQGMLMALSSPAFRQELAELIRPHWSQEKTGLPGYVLNRNLLMTLWEKWTVHYGVGIARKAKEDQQRLLQAPALVFITTKGDVPKHWFLAGRAYTRVALLATHHKISNWTTAATVEAADFHEDIEAALHTSQRLQSVLRLGYARTSKRRHTPRLAVKDLLTTT